jgi:hypothetical protein
MSRQIKIRVGDVPWPVAAISHQYHPIIGFFAGGSMPQDLCLRHAGRYRAWNRGQLMSIADARYEGLNPDQPDFWCQKCAEAHAWPNHEYLIQPYKYGFEVLDLSAVISGVAGPVVHTGSWDDCEKWTNDVKEHKHEYVLV